MAHHDIETLRELLDNFVKVQADCYEQDVRDMQRNGFIALAARQSNIIEQMRQLEAYARLDPMPDVPGIDATRIHLYSVLGDNGEAYNALWDELMHRDVLTTGTP